MYHCYNCLIQVSLAVKSKHESEDALEAFEEIEELVEEIGEEREMNTEVNDTDVQIISPEEVISLYRLFMNQTIIRNSLKIFFKT